MEIKHELQGDRLTVSVEGRLDTNTAPTFQETIAPLIPGTKTMDIDMSGVEYVSSAGLRALLFLHKESTKDDSAMTIHGCPPVVMDVFRMTGFDKVLNLK